MRILLILLLAVLETAAVEYLYNNPTYYHLDDHTWESDDFRAMRLGEYAAGLETLDPDQLAAWMAEMEYDLTGWNGEGLDSMEPRLQKPAAFRKLADAYRTIFQDLKYFPIPESTNPETPPVSYENGWMDPRTYGGKRGHEGCDIMGNACPRGFYPVVSISDGTVEHVGWLNQGGWRIGIRTPSGLYLYYAHLYEYSRQWQEGDQVSAGQLLGFMGDSGYSDVEGTVGNFDVHLHVGMYLKTDHYEEMSINPYWILRYLEKRRLRFCF